MFRSEAGLKTLYEQLSRQAVLTAKAEQVANFLGKKITPLLARELGSRFTTRIEGTSIKHRLGSTGVKMYDKLGRVLLETTINDVFFFKHYRKVEHRDRHTTRGLVALKKTIHSLIGLGALERPEFNMHSVRRAHLTPFVPELSPSRLSRQLHHLRSLGLLKTRHALLRKLRFKFGSVQIIMGVGWVKGWRAVCEPEKVFLGTQIALNFAAWTDVNSRGSIIAHSK